MSGAGKGTKGGGTAPSAGKGGRAAIRAAVEGAAPVVKTPFEMPHGFEMRTDGLWREGSRDNDKPFRVCGPLEVVAESRDEASREWGVLLRWKDRDSTEHEWIMPRRLVVGEAVAVRERLAEGGLHVGASEGARRALVQFLTDVRGPQRVRTVPRTGWFRPAGDAPVFVLPGRTIGSACGEVVRLDLDPPPSVYVSRGTLDGWRTTVPPLCVGNSRLTFAVSCAFAAPLLHLAGDEGGGINLRGESSKGKTTIIDAAASVWGPPSKTGPDGFVRQWRTTPNALESTALAHNHALLPLDEMNQADPKEVGETLYMLANGAGKERARAGGGNRRGTTWLTLVLSSSEESAASMAAQAGRRIKAGQEVRLLDVPAVVPGGFGCFDTLHGEADGSGFAQAMRRAVVAEHGTAAPAFLEKLAARLAAEPDFAADVLDARVRAWTLTHVPKGADGQVHRAARRLALVAVAGELATEAGITGWPAGEAEAAAATIFRDWLAERGGTGSREDHHLFAALRRFIAAHGSARFETVKDATEEADEGAQVEPPLPEGVRIIQRAGWRWQEASETGERRWVYGLVPEIFAQEIAAPLGLEDRDARRRLGRAGMIRGSKEGGEIRWSIYARTIPGYPRMRLIVVEPTALQGEAGE
jgi:uncharacterized protein (DUF927 family)